MSTITPTSDQHQTADVTTFRIGDRVRDAQNRTGQIVTPQGVPPQAVPAAPATLSVDVRWDDDGAVTTVLLSTLNPLMSPVPGSSFGPGDGGGGGIDSPPPPQGGPR